MIGDTIKQTLTEWLNEVWYYVSFQFIDPFWGWAFAVAVYVIAITILLALYRFYFGALPGWLQKLFGLSVFAAIAALFVYRKGEKDAREHDAKLPKPKSNPPVNQNNQWKWPFT